MSGNVGIDLTGKKALVTGGSRGIGRAIAVRLAEAGCDVAINYLRSRAPAQETAEAVEACGRRAFTYKVNVAQTEKLDDMFSAIEDEFGGLDILVSNAASGVIKPAMELTPREPRRGPGDPQLRGRRGQQGGPGEPRPAPGGRIGALRGARERDLGGGRRHGCPETLLKP
jgi:NAD(P)-dependent dehydrogenase (short-subunit alcohol dehydrogenase family)